MSSVESIKRILGVSNAYEWHAPDGSFRVKWEDGAWYRWQNTWANDKWKRYDGYAEVVLNDWFKHTAPIEHWRDCMKDLYKQGLRI